MRSPAPPSRSAASPYRNGGSDPVGVRLQRLGLVRVRDSTASRVPRTVAEQYRAGSAIDRGSLRRGRSGVLRHEGAGRVARRDRDWRGRVRARAQQHRRGARRAAQVDLLGGTLRRRQADQLTSRRRCSELSCGEPRVHRRSSRCAVAPLRVSRRVLTFGELPDVQVVLGVARPAASAASAARSARDGSAAGMSTASM